MDIEINMSYDELKFAMNVVDEIYNAALDNELGAIEPIHMLMNHYYDFFQMAHIEEEIEAPTFDVFERLVGYYLFKLETKARLEAEAQAEREAQEALAAQVA